MMITDFQIPEPFQFNPLKHHLSFIRGFISNKLSEEERIDIKALVKELKHIGTSVMDVYTGILSVNQICDEVSEFLTSKRLIGCEVFIEWAGRKFSDFRTIAISDNSQWMLKFHDNESRYVHLFPARLSPHTFRVKANTLKSAILYYILIGKDFISADDLNRARTLFGLSPVKDPDETEAITEMIEILRN
ncbi:MAG: hypothetical protein A2V64_11980 [Bacteroidetes bacterium RBG_13_43_22]|nr:MAG: hypothetical protein A2V64_11980 [Bacteroidetes bacterium RBG_13_43_22]